MTDDPMPDRDGWLTFSSVDELLAWLQADDDDPEPPDAHLSRTGSAMTDEQSPVTSDELKAAIRPVRAVLARLPKGWATEQAEQALDVVRDRGLKAIETPATALHDPFDPRH